MLYFAHYSCILCAAGRRVRIVLLLMNIIKSVHYPIHVNFIEDMQCKLKTEFLVLKRFVTLILEDSYAPIVTTINAINGKILTPA